MTKERILLALGIKVDSNISHKERARLLLKDAKKMRHGKWDPGYGDNKHLVYPSGIESLLSVGGEVRSLNRKTIGDYVHEVSYKGHFFIATTRNLYNFH